MWNGQGHSNGQSRLSFIVFFVFFFAFGPARLMSIFCSPPSLSSLCKWTEDCSSSFILARGLHAWVARTNFHIREMSATEYHVLSTPYSYGYSSQPSVLRPWRSSSHWRSTGKRASRSRDLALRYCTAASGITYRPKAATKALRPTKPDLCGWLHAIIIRSILWLPRMYSVLLLAELVPVCTRHT